MLLASKNPMIDLKPSINFWHDLKSNQVAGLWLFLGSRKSLQIVHPSILQLLFWGAVAASVNTLYSWMVAGQVGHFNSQGLVSYALWPFIALIVGIFLSQRMNNTRLMLVPALLWLVLDSNVLLIQCFLQYLGDNNLLNFLPDRIYNFLPTLFMVFFVWQSLAVIWVFSRELKWPWWERALIMFATICTLVVWQMSVKQQPIWKVDDSPPTISEDALYAQGNLLRQTLEQIQLGDFSQTHWYFLGVAGDSYDSVFSSEVQRIKAQFDTRFGTLGRSVQLVNDPDTITKIPIASKTSIQMALNRIGQQMNKDTDVLFMYLTSHGLENHFELENAPIDLKQIDPEWLRGALDKSGIKWRVIVISACYSGSFIPALQSENTLVITASAADRSSFGCNSESDYTYFGRAFFDQAMREKSTLHDAFNDAQSTVSKWENAQGFQPSEPQWVLGKSIELMLPQLEKHLFPSATVMPNNANQIPLSTVP